VEIAPPNRGCNAGAPPYGSVDVRAGDYLGRAGEDALTSSNIGVHMYSVYSLLLQVVRRREGRR
jgi:hypothetical protein